MATEIKYDEAKFKELMLYVASQTEDDLEFGAVKLNKVLFYSDFLHFAQKGTPITGALYQRLQHGPAPRKLLPVRLEMMRAGDAYLDKSYYMGRVPVARLVAKRPPNLSLFTPDELKFVDNIIKMVSDGTASDISNLSHDEMGWKLARHKEPIPYEAVWLSFDPPTADDEERARELSREFGLVGADAGT